MQRIIPPCRAFPGKYCSTLQTLWSFQYCLRALLPRKRTKLFFHGKTLDFPTRLQPWEIFVFKERSFRIIITPRATPTPLNTTVRSLVDGLSDHSFVNIEIRAIMINVKAGSPVNQISTKFTSSFGVRLTRLRTTRYLSYSSTFRPNSCTFLSILS